MSPPMELSQPPESDAPHRGWRRLWPRRWRHRALLAGALALLVPGSITWLGREQIVGNLIDSYLAERGIAARYRLVEISPTRQIIADLAVGDPAAPDLTAKRVVIDLELGLFGAAVERVTLDHARLFGTLRDGKLSLGALDPLIFAGRDAPASLPEITLTLNDARARIDSDVGVVAAKLAGAGRLDDGFVGTLAVTAPGLGTPDCRAERATLFGTLTTAKGAPRLTGPIRLGAVACGGITLAAAELGSRITLPATLDAVRGKFAVAAASLDAGPVSIARLAGSASAAVSAKGIVLDHDLTATRLDLPQLAVGEASAAGRWRSGLAATRGAMRGEWSGEIGARRVALDDSPLSSLQAAQRAAAGTLLEPLIGQFASALTHALGGASLTSAAILRVSGKDISLIVPEARLRSAAGAVIAAVSDASWDSRSGSARGNLVTAGAGLPRLNGRITAKGEGGFALRLAMADYTAGTSRLAIPELIVEQGAKGAARFTGLVTASGALPGGQINGLELPLEGTWTQAEGLTLGTRCTALRFAALKVAALELAGQRLALCPADGRAMLRYRDTLSVGARTASLALRGTLGGAPVRARVDSGVLRYPGPLALEGVELTLGEPGSQTRLALANLAGTLGPAPSGTFAGGNAVIADLPFALDQLAGQWSYADAALAVEDAGFVLTDRIAGQARFEPLAARGGALRFAGDAITAQAALFHPASGQKVVAVDLVHNLATAAGRADLLVDALTFGPALDAEDLSYRIKGVIAFARGTVNGRGRVIWDREQITSDGTFRTDGLDFAAAFGPVRGLKGEIRFTDLLNFTTAPDQRLTIASINPGIEVLEGRLTFALTNGEVIAISDARWPFMGGTLVLRPVVLDFGRPSEKRYIFEVGGLDAATFVAELELGNIAVSGTFDGTVPVVFDAGGNGRVDHGLLRARPPGGNVSYIGDLTYEDMGAISNYAFSALRSLDYRAMSVALDGSLTGEIISRFAFDGIRQGAGTSRNFITRRLAALPIQFRVNVRSESFYELSTVLRSFWDVNMLGNPVDRGLLKAENGRFVPAKPSAPQPSPDAPVPAPLPETMRRDEPAVQPSESDKTL